MTKELIDRQTAIDAIEKIRWAIWEVDIPSPTVPEYIEHHNQMQCLIEKCNELIEYLEKVPCSEYN